MTVEISQNGISYLVETNYVHIWEINCWSEFISVEKRTVQVYKTYSLCKQLQLYADRDELFFLCFCFKKFNYAGTMEWISGKVPISVPVCGFQNEHCKSGKWNCNIPNVRTCTYILTNKSKLNFLNPTLSFRLACCRD